MTDWFLTLPSLQAYSDIQLWQRLFAVVIASLLAGLLLARLMGARRRQQLRDENLRLQLLLDSERSQHQQFTEHLNSAHSELRQSFEALAARSLRDNNVSFLNLARESLGAQQQRASGELEKREQAIQHLVKPIADALLKTERQLGSIENERQKSFGQITEQLLSMASTQATLQDETRRLVGALKRPEVRGQWGELNLRRLVELAGMVEHCDFVEQAHTQTSGGPIRPDMIVNLPENRQLIIDVKTPLDAYLNALEARDDDERKAALKRHARNVQQRVRELGSKSYWQQFEQSPEFVVLYIPGDQFLSAALDVQPQLLEEALQQQVILATPTSLVALLRAVAYGWKQLTLADNVAQMRDLASDFYGKLVIFSDHLTKMGKQLGSSVDHYNRAVGSLERNVLSSARRFTELGLSVKQPLVTPETVSTTLRTPAVEPAGSSARKNARKSVRESVSSSNSDSDANSNVASAPPAAANRSAREE